MPRRWTGADVGVRTRVVAQLHLVRLADIGEATFWRIDRTADRRQDVDGFIQQGLGQPVKRDAGLRESGEVPTQSVRQLADRPLRGGARFSIRARRSIVMMPT